MGLVLLCVLLVLAVAAPVSQNSPQLGNLELPSVQEGSELIMVTGVTPTHGGILNLNKMVQQVTGKVAFFSYWPYGCHCGPGGRGQPKDATDWCCRVHDCCYARLKKEQCRIHMDHYKYSFSQGAIQCSARGSWCEKQLCTCDKEVAFCLQRNLDTYQKHLRYYWRPRCKDQTPKC